MKEIQPTIIYWFGERCEWIWQHFNKTSYQINLLTSFGDMANLGYTIHSQHDLSIIYVVLDKTSSNDIPVIVDLLKSLTIVFYVKDISVLFEKQLRTLLENVLENSPGGIIFRNDESRIWFEHTSGIVNYEFLIFDSELLKLQSLEVYPYLPPSRERDSIRTIAHTGSVILSNSEMDRLTQAKISINFFQPQVLYVQGSTQSLRKEVPWTDEPTNGRGNISSAREYAAVWLPVYSSQNHYDLSKVVARDLMPCEEMYDFIGTEIPMIQQDNCDHINATQAFTKKYNLGIFYNTFGELIRQLQADEIAKIARTKFNRIVSESANPESLLAFMARIKSKTKNPELKTSEEHTFIPKIIHQTWKDRNIPEHFQIFMDTWKDLHPEWQFVLWTDQDNRNFIKENYPDFLRIYDMYPSNIQRVDAVRYFILYHFGGVYIDLDYECLENIEPLLTECDAFFGTEPEEHCKQFNKALIVSNAFMGCKPKNLFFRYVCDMLRITQIRERNSLINTLETTGPFILTRLIGNYKGADLIKLIPSSDVCPLSISEIRQVLSQQMDDNLQQKVDKAYAVHYFWGNWWSDLN